jgi:hypothetical protein
MFFIFVSNFLFRCGPVLIDDAPDEFADRDAELLRFGL